MCVYMCVCVYVGIVCRCGVVCVCVWCVCGVCVVWCVWCVCVCARARTPEDSLSCCSSGAIHLGLETG